MSSLLSLFGFGKPDPEKVLKDASRDLKKKSRGVEREIRKMEVSHKNALASVKKMIKDGHSDAARDLIRNVIQFQKDINRRMIMKTHLESLSDNMKIQLSQLKLSRVIEKSTPILKEMNLLSSFKEMKGTMKELSRELERSGLISERMDDTFESIDNVGDDLVDEEVDKLMEQLTSEQLSATSNVPTAAIPIPTTLPVAAAPQVPGTETSNSAEDEKWLEEMRARNNAV